MNIQVRSASRYCGKTTISILLACSIQKVLSKDVFIVTNEIEDYGIYFSACEQYKESFLVNEQSIIGEIHLTTKVTEDLKAMCIQVTKGIYILPLRDPEVKFDLAQIMQRVPEVFIFDNSDKDINPVYLRTILFVFDNQEKKIRELLERYSRMTDMEKYRTIFVCNKFMIGYDNQDRVIRLLNSKRDQIIFMKYLFMFKNQKKDGILDFIYKSLDKQPDYVQYDKQLRELAQYGN